MGRETTKHAVVICHGYQAGPLFTSFIGRTLRKSGLFDQVLNLGLYNSWYGLITDRYSVVSPIINVDDTHEIDVSGTLVEHVHNQLREQLKSKIDVIHFLGHSMGGLVIRSLLKAIIMPNIKDWLFEKNSPIVGSIIQLATPNNGTKITTMRMVQWLGHLRMAYYFRKIHAKRILHLIKYKIDRLRGVEESETGYTHDYEYPTSQLEQMRPGCVFLEWLNSDPTYTEIPHYVLIGTKNSFIFTDYIWRETPSDYLDEVDTNTVPSEKELSMHIGSENQTIGEDITSIELLKYENPVVTPNDGVVSIHEARLPGANWIDLGIHAKHITHNGIIAWFLPDKHHQFVKTSVLSIYENLIDH
ncbi:MAG: esterase/lipase family protein [Candidatus Kariarchaeaceae archaeon]|jgi:hypothetical protein